MPVYTYKCPVCACEIVRIRSMNASAEDATCNCGASAPRTMTAPSSIRCTPHHP